MFRDLKPTNEGINCYEVVKLFDFGLAKELNEERKIGLNQYKAAQCTESRRYMAKGRFHHGVMHVLKCFIY